MPNTIINKFLLLALAVILSGCSATRPQAATPGETEETTGGYFLTLEQKGQLLWMGQVQDGTGNWYDIWIVPGYRNQGLRAKKYTILAGDNLEEYVQAEKYRKLKKESKDAFEWAYDDCLVDFTIEGVPRAWNKYWSKASERSSKRVFGWWFAYPWAFLEGTVDNAFRVPAGLTGAASGMVWGAAVVPVYHATNSAVKASWNFAVNAVLISGIGTTWNTVIAPPLSLVGQQPAPARVDGFWVTRLSQEDVIKARALEMPPTPEETEALAEWGRWLLITSKPYETRRTALEKASQEEISAIRQKLQQATNQIDAEEKEAIGALATNSPQKEAKNRLENLGFNGAKTNYASEEVRKYLENRHELSEEEIRKLIKLLRQYPPIDSDQPALRRKTEPVQRSLQVIDEIK